MDWMPQTIREGLLTILFISGPLVVLAAVLGLVIGVIQAATQVQEQTLGSAVKIIGLFIALIIFGFYMFQYLTKYTSDSLQRAFKLVPSLGSYVKPRRNFLTVKPENQQLETPRPPGELSEMNIPKPGGKKVSGDGINAPEVVSNNQSQSGLNGVDRLGKPSRQIKTENPNLKKQELNIARQPAPTAPAQPARQAATAPAQPARQAATAPAQPVRQPAPAPQPARQPAPAPQPVRQTAPAPQPARQPAPAPEQAAPAPAQPPRRSLDDAISRLKNNFNQPVGAQ